MDRAVTRTLFAAMMSPPVAVRNKENFRACDR
jgi:hypothetical protein